MLSLESILATDWTDIDLSVMWDKFAEYGLFPPRRYEMKDGVCRILGGRLIIPSYIAHKLDFGAFGVHTLYAPERLGISDQKAELTGDKFVQCLKSDQVVGLRSVRLSNIHIEADKLAIDGTFSRLNNCTFDVNEIIIKDTSVRLENCKGRVDSYDIHEPFANEMDCLDKLIIPQTIKLDGRRKNIAKWKHFTALINNPKKYPNIKQLVPELASIDIEKLLGISGLGVQRIIIQDNNVAIQFNKNTGKEASLPFPTIPCGNWNVRWAKK